MTVTDAKWGIAFVTEVSANGFSLSSTVHMI
jgi:hypothetical protein